MSASELLDPFNYPWFSVWFFLALWSFSHVTYFLLGRWIPTFSELDEGKKRNTVTYVAEIVVTTFAFISQLVGGLDILLRVEDTTTASRLDWLAMSFHLIAILYLWELIYRQRTDWPLLVHHLITLLFIQMCVLAFNETGELVYIRGGIVLGFQSTTEQLSFLALFCFRTGILQGKPLSSLFKIAAAQSFLFKGVAAVGTVYIYAVGVRNDHFYDGLGTTLKVAIVPLIIGLFASQVYASKVLYVLGQRVVSDKDAVAENHVEIRETDVEEARDSDVEQSTA